MDNTDNQNNNRDDSSSMDGSGIDTSNKNQSNVETKGLKTDEKGRFVKGTAPGPGRPKGSLSVIGRLKQMWEEDPEDFEEFVEEYKKDPNNRKHITEMIDGKPKQTIAGDNDNPLRIITVDPDLAKLYGITPQQPEDDSERLEQI